MVQEDYYLISKTRRRKKEQIEKLLSNIFGRGQDFWYGRESVCILIINFIIYFFFGGLTTNQPTNRTQDQTTISLRLSSRHKHNRTRFISNFPVVQKRKKCCTNFSVNNE